MSWIQITIELLFSGLIFVLVKWVGPNAVQTKFQSKLEDHRSELSTILEVHKHALSRELEGLRAENARLLHNFGLFNSKRHEVYSQLYEYFLDAQGHLYRKTIKLVQLDSFDGYGIDSIAEYARGRRFPDQIIASIVEKWSSDKDAARKLVWEWDTHYNRSEMSKAVTVFHNYYLSRILYLSEAVREAFKDIDGHIVLGRHSYESYDNWRSQAQGIRMGYGGETYADLARKSMEELEWHVQQLDEQHQKVMALMIDEMKNGIL